MFKLDDIELYTYNELSEEAKIGLKKIYGMIGRKKYNIRW